MDDWLVVPMLADPFPSDSHAMRFLAKEGWRAEQKLDGVRLVLHIHDGKVIGINRRGVPTTVPAPVVAAFAGFTGEWVFDGELVSGVFWIFDMPRAADKIDLTTPYGKRREVLEDFFPRMNFPGCVKLLRSFTDEVGKTSLAIGLKKLNAEGMMLKDCDAPYTQGIGGRRSPDIFKWKFWESVDCIVRELWREGKRSMGVYVYDENGMEVDIGSVTMTPTNMAKLVPGDVVECKYLYVDNLSKPRLYQPAFLRKRLDKMPNECLLSQLKLTNKEVVQIAY